jgi:hypothetical protein
MKTLYLSYTTTCNPTAHINNVGYTSNLFLNPHNVSFETQVEAYR